MTRTSRTPLLLALLCCMASSAPAFADTCLNTDKQKYAEGDARSYDYGKCKSTGPDNSYNSLNAIGQQMQGIMQERQAAQDADRAAIQRSNAAFLAERAQLWSKMKYGTSLELVNGQESVAIYQYRNASIPEARQQAIRAEIGTAVNAGQLLETYGGGDYTDGAAYYSEDPAAKWKACEVATLLVRAYTFGDFVKPGQKDPAKGFAIAAAGTKNNCGGTAYWLGRIYEGGDAIAPGVDKALDKYPHSRIRQAYETAIVNGVLAAYERAAETNMHPLPRYKDRKYLDIGSFSRSQYWYEPQGEEYQLARIQYRKCLDFEPANLVCARGLRDLYSLDEYPFKPDVDLSAYYRDYVGKLEKLLAASGQ